MTEKKETRLSIMLKGIIKENPVLVLVLGTCPTLAVTSSVLGAFSMGLAALFVLVCSNVVISALRKIIPDSVRIPCYIVIIAGFVTIVKLIVKAYLPDIDVLLGSYLDLIVVNCIILGRAEMFARENSVVDSALDGIGMGIGFTLALVAMATVREVFGAGAWFGIEIPLLSSYKIPVLTQAPGGFFVFGALMAILAAVSGGKATKKKEFGCSGCPQASVCGRIGTLDTQKCEKKEAQNA